MPFYQYDCEGCGSFEANRPVSESAEPHACPECGGHAPRTLASPHVRTSWAGIRYIAEARNEKSAHEPATEHRLRSGGGHGHHAHAHAGPGHGHARRNQRPWMIGH